MRRLYAAGFQSQCLLRVIPAPYPQLMPVVAIREETLQFEVPNLFPVLLAPEPHQPTETIAAVGDRRDGMTLNVAFDEIRFDETGESVEHKEVTPYRDKQHGCLLP